MLDFKIPPNLTWLLKEPARPEPVDPSIHFASQNTQGDRHGVPKTRVPLQGEFGVKGCERHCAKKEWILSGHSLIELTVVLTIFTFFSGLSIGTLSYLERMTVRCAAEKLFTDISHIQQQALVSGEPQTIELSEYVLSRGVHFSAITFPHEKIIAAASGVICAGSVYLTDDKNWTYAVTVPVGGAAARIAQK